MASRPFRIAGVAVGAVGAIAGVAGAAYAAQRAAARRLRTRPDPDAGDAFSVPTDRVHRLPSHDGGTVYVTERGDGRAIVLSHGVTLSVRTWTKQLQALPEEGFRVVAFDHRGHGESALGEGGHSIDNLAADVRTVLEALDLRHVVLVGHSMGGIALLAFMIRHPDVATERVAGIVLLSTLARSPSSRMKWLNAVLERVADRTPDLASVMQRPDVGMLVARFGFGKDPQPSHVELTRQMIADCAPDTRHGATRALLGLDLSADLPSITLPTLVICGTADLVTPPSESRRIAGLIPGARLELIEGAGHMLMLERAQEVDHLIADFAREVSYSPARSQSM